jgi:hypothetical protein
LNRAAARVGSRPDWRREAAIALYLPELSQPIAAAHFSTAARHGRFQLKM